MPPSRFRRAYTWGFLLLLFFSSVFVAWNSLQNGFGEFENSFYKRNDLIGLNNGLHLRLGDRVIQQALIGPDGWLNYSGDENIEDFQRLSVFQNQTEILGGLAHLNQLLKSQNIRLLIVVTPNKPTIYPESMPPGLPPAQRPAKLDVFFARLQAQGIDFVDLRPALREARLRHELYYKSDTHWNGYGAFAAYGAIVQKLQPDFPALPVLPEEKMTLTVTEPYQLEIPSMLIVTDMTEKRVDLTPPAGLAHSEHPEAYNEYDQFSWTANSQLPTLLMFHDSFGARYLDDDLSASFAKSHFIHINSMSRNLSPESLQKFQPDILIIEIAERNLNKLILYFPEFMKINAPKFRLKD
ncbi:MAG: hypothetical protein Fur0035_09900 [Anaerolineales bacterium]